MINIEILVGSTLGATEYVAEATQPLLEEAGYSSNIHFTPDLSSVNVTTDSYWLICLATHGAGDYPDNFKPFAEQVNQLNETDLSHIHFGLIGVGDSNYDTYCFAAQHFNTLLLNKGAHRLTNIFEIDVIESPIPEDRLVDWIPLFIKDLNNITK